MYSLLLYRNAPNAGKGCIHATVLNPGENTHVHGTN
jgi:hypothetical protein